MKDRIIPALFADAVATAHFLSVSGGEIVKALVLGFIAGAVGMFGKDVYAWLKSIFIKKSK